MSHLLMKTPPTSRFCTRLLCGLLVSFAFSDCARAGDDNAVSDRRRTLAGDPSKLLKSSDPIVAREAAGKLIELAEASIKTGWSIEHAKSMSEVFQESTDLDHRKQAFSLLYEHARGELQGLTKRIDITTPMYGCIGRFHGGVQHTLRTQLDGVWMVAISQGRVPEGVSKEPRRSLWQPEGPPAVLVLHVYTSPELEAHTVLKALSDSRYFDMKSWTVSVEKPVLELIAEMPTK